MKRNIGRCTILVLVLSMILGIASTSQAKNYYVDAKRGSDSAKGNKRSPWQTVARVNEATMPAGSTVHFKAGRSYGTAVLNAHSGSDGSPVTYTSYGTGAKPKLGGFNAAGKSHLKASRLSLSAATTVVNLTNASHVEVDDCDIKCTATEWAPAVTIQSNAHHNRIINNTITQSQAKNDTINLRGNADYNLIAGNKIDISGIHCAIGLEGHTGGGTADYNIVKNNVITGHKGGGALIALQANSNRNLIEGNVLSGDSTMSEHCGTNPHARHQTMLKLVSMNNIVRNNIIKNYPCKDSLGLDMGAYTYGGFNNIATGNHVYNNVITGVSVGGTPLHLGENGTGGKTFNNTFKNNIIYNNGGTWYQTRDDGSWPRASSSQQMKIQVSLNVRDNYFVNNIFYKSDATNILWVNNAYASVAQAQSWKPDLFWGNLQADPLLDPKSQRPLAGSPVKDAGASLTTITSASGSGTTITVDDAYYFSDGFGIINGDNVQINNQLVAIKAVNYATNTLTLARSISWTEGDAVNLPYSGKAPDIGAFE
ncbi:MAG: hypothetical protein A2075_09595 [Geobacteraceae bacterium GWC2_58_44]|nr:MAG: hypothetical protein A2075_09595 [Geobacteraceae bacterium GWC2_58_44]HBG07223.1 hypothetical protein [Geobacter sp.]